MIPQLHKKKNQWNSYSAKSEPRYSKGPYTGTVYIYVLTVCAGAKNTPAKVNKSLGDNKHKQELALKNEFATSL